MNRRQKIIVSVTGIFLVLLFLIGLTYGYFLTKITGNNNEKSISVTTANLQLVYGDDNGNVIGENEVIEPNTTFDAKTFTVTNEGNAITDYVVVIENATSTFTNNDFVYTLTCTSDGESCTGVDTETIYSINGGVLVANKIEVGKTHTYSFILKYVDTGSDQSEDMNKTLTGKINIKDPNSLNPYVGNKETLAYNIINNAVLGKNGTTLSAAPNTNVAVAVSTASEKVLSVTQDDLGTSYYYRGAVEDNYVNFAGMCWKVVRIAGDGSIKLILEDKNTTCESSTYTGNWSLGTGNYGYDGTSGNYKMNYLNPVTNNASSMVKAFYDFQTTALKDYTTKLKAGDWCLGDTAYTRTGSSSLDYTYTLLSDTSSNYSSRTSFYYDAYARLTGNNKDGYSPSLKCNGTKLDKFATVTNVSEETSMYVSALTADEVVFAGGIVLISNNYTYSINQNYYLINEEFKKGSSGVIGSYYFWILSPFEFNGSSDFAFIVVSDGCLSNNDVFSSLGSNSLRPAVSLASNITISSGNGTITNPYIVE